MMTNSRTRATCTLKILATSAHTPTSQRLGMYSSSSESLRIIAKTPRKPTKSENPPMITRSKFMGTALSKSEFQTPSTNWRYALRKP